METSNRVLVTILAASFAATAFASGCGHVRQARDHASPYAVPSVMAEQTLNPEAGRNRKVVAGLDSGAAANVHAGYVKSFVRSDGQSTKGFQGLDALSTD